MHWLSLHLCFLFCHFCLLFVFFLPDVLGSNVAVRGGNLKQKKAGGGLEGRAQRLPPNALGVFACVVFFCHFCFLLLVIFLRDVLGSNVAVRGGNLKQKKAGPQMPPRCIGCLCMCCFFPVIFVFFLCFFFLMFLEAMWQ